jgi:2-hydroxychromene-2-carboxylate isomerase
MPATTTTTTIDYFLAPQSPWTYLGHARFVQMAREAGAVVQVRPADFGQVFAASGGLPLPKRAPQRQAYRLVELQRFSAHLGVPLNLQPAFFPVAADPAARLIVAVAQADGSGAALALAGRIFEACWVQQRNIAESATLAALLAEAGLAEARLAASLQPEAEAAYAANTAQALAAGVFGAPSYVVDGEIFWGQDRLDFLARRLGVGK